MANKILKIGTTSTTEEYVPLPWLASNVYSGITAAELAAFVLPKADEVAYQKAQELMAKDGLQVPVILVDAGESLSKEELQNKVAQAAQQYETENIPGFLRDLINFADEKPVSYTTPGHHNGQFYEKHPAGVVFKKFFGDNMLRADVSDTVAELGDTLTHGGTPLDSEQEAAQAFNADKVYYVTNGTTSSNTICANAVLSEGDLVLFDRNNHKSLYNSALIMTGAKPVYLPTSRNPLGLIGPVISDGLDEEKIRAEIAKVDPERAKAKRPFRMAVLQLETFDGIFYNAKWLLDKIGKLCDYVLFDCAWGGYEQFVNIMKQLSPLQYKYTADDPGILVTQSIHKQQAGLAQTSQILKKDAHIKGQKRYVDHKHFNNAYLKYVTTSYSYPIYASLTVNTALAKGEAPKKWWEEAMKKGIRFRKTLNQKSKLFKTLNAQEINKKSEQELMDNLSYWKMEETDDWHGFKGVAKDEAIISPLKLTVVCPGINLATGKYEETGIPGKVIGEYLTEKRVITCKSDLYSTLFLLTPGERDADLEALLTSFLEFEEYYLRDAPLEQVLPRLVKQNPERYQGYTIRQLCQEMHEYYAKNEIYKLQKELFLKKTFQDYEMTPAEADKLFMKNEGELVDLDEIEGRVALEGALPYPPGVFIVAPGERWQKIDVDYFKILMGAIDKFPGFDPEIQGVYLNKDTGVTKAQGFVL
ncbi:putative ornithine decarboxylase [Ligilactobacillus salivarius]|uniref:Ornithine decarboxylase n=2 Tax=Ligilactobacillus salivarius TaxID=1624 RepID=A0A1V9R7F2_9LACO|nr:putative ornithine decarboxylase [Ligilactobacillus salivarius]OQQ86490.1 ornithine decarboxylase [Ligilactobacillus salivarius]OQQ89028.1 ornithine decarboxylase [Ligilactobacillus salivarius]